MDTRFRQEHNRASILLSLIRTRLTSSEYGSLLLVLNWADQLLVSVKSLLKKTLYGSTRADSPVRSAPYGWVN